MKLKGTIDLLDYQVNKAFGKQDKNLREVLVSNFFVLIITWMLWRVVSETLISVS